MSDNASPSDEDSFVIAGVTFRGGAELIQWSSGQVAAVAPVEITVGAGITVTVDVARPSAILEIKIADFGDPALLSQACEPGAAPLVDDIVRGATPSGVELTLRPDWARKALVAGISRWMPRPVHEGALLLDDAAAHQAVGESAAAARLVALSTPVLEALTLDCEDGFLSTATAVELKSISQSCAEAVAQVNWGHEIEALAARAAVATGLSQIDLDEALRQLTEHDHSELVGSLTAGDAEPAGSLTSGAQAAQSMPQVVDPATTTARVIRWVGSSYEELHVTTSPTDVDMVADFVVELSDFVDDRSLEAGRVIAYVADATTGALLRTGRTRVTGRTLTATLRYEVPASGRVAFGVFDADKGSTKVRARLADRTRIAVDRLLLDAWCRHRGALVVQTRIAELDTDASEEAASRAVDLLDQAVDLVDEARGKLAFQLQQGDGTDEARSRAVDAYLAELRSQKNVPHPGCGPLLAELLPVTSDVG